MAIGSVDEFEFLEELAKLQGSASQKGIVKVRESGRKVGNVAIPDEIKKLVAEELLQGASAKEVSEALNVSKSSASAYKNGANSTATYDTPNENLTKHINDIKSKMSKKASEKLELALDSITEDKITDLSANKAAMLAKDMSSIIRDMEPADKGGTTIGQVIIHAPRVRNEDEYEVIDIQNAESSAPQF